MKVKLLLSIGVGLLLSGGLVLAGYRHKPEVKTMQPQESKPVELTEVEKPEEKVTSETVEVKQTTQTTTKPVANTTQAAQVSVPTPPAPVTVTKVETKCDLPVPGKPGAFQAQKITYYSDGSTTTVLMPAYCGTTGHVVNTGN